MILFRLDMPLWLMGFYGGAMALLLLILRPLVLRFFPKRVMPVLWGLVLVRLLVPFSFSTPISLPVPEFLQRQVGITEVVMSSPATAILEEGTMDLSSTVICQSDEMAVPVAESFAGFGDVLWNNLPFRMEESFGWLWAFGAVALAAGMAVRYARERRGLVGLYEIEENPVVRSALLTAKVSAKVLTCDTARSPMVFGWARPVILLPASMDFADTATLRHILTHEAMHIRRRDNLFKCVMALALCLHWMNPFVWFMARQLCRDLEGACDEAALALMGGEEKRSYAESLLHMARPDSMGGIFTSAFSRTEVERRIKAVLSYRKLGAFSLAASLVLVFTTATAFAACPQTFFDDSLGDWCGGGEQNFVVCASLNRPIDLGKSRDYARSRANSAVLEVLREAEAGTSAKELKEKIAQRLSQVFGVEPSAFQVKIAFSMDPEQLEEEYLNFGIQKTPTGWSYQGKTVHLLEDRAGGTYFQGEKGEVDIYVMRDEEYRITKVESYLSYRF